MIGDEIAALERQPIVIPKRRLFRSPRYFLMALPFFICFVGGPFVQIGMLWSASAAGFDLGGMAFFSALVSVLLISMTSLAWNTLGEEVISIDKQQLTRRRHVLCVGVSSRWAADAIGKIEARAWSGNELRDALWGIGSGKVRFLVGRQSQSLGIALTDSEAEQLANRLREWRITESTGGAAPTSMDAHHAAQRTSFKGPAARRQTRYAAGHRRGGASDNR